MATAAMRAAAIRMIRGVDMAISPCQSAAQSLSPGRRQAAPLTNPLSASPDSIVSAANDRVSDGSDKGKSSPAPAQRRQSAVGDIEPLERVDVAVSGVVTGWRGCCVNRCSGGWPATRTWTTGLGHQEWFPPASLRDRCGFRQGTFAGSRQRVRRADSGHSEGGVSTQRVPTTPNLWCIIVATRLGYIKGVSEMGYRSDASRTMRFFGRRIRKKPNSVLVIKFSTCVNEFTLPRHWTVLTVSKKAR